MQMITPFKRQKGSNSQNSFLPDGREGMGGGAWANPSVSSSVDEIGLKQMEYDETRQGASDKHKRKLTVCPVGLFRVPVRRLV